MTAKALAKECGATFLNVNSSMLLDKYLGESDKLVASLFSLARKLAPSVIFVDEAEAIFRKRSSDSNGVSQHIGSLQSVFLAEWDGLKSSSSMTGGNEMDHCPVIVLAATNRPMDIDPAFLRRMPVSIKTKSPDEKQRVDILKCLLTKEIVHA